MDQRTKNLRSKTMRKFWRQSCLNVPFRYTHRKTQHICMCVNVIYVIFVNIYTQYVLSSYFRWHAIKWYAWCIWHNRTQFWTLILYKNHIRIRKVRDLMELDEDLMIQNWVLLVGYLFVPYYRIFLILFSLMLGEITSQ